MNQHGTRQRVLLAKIGLDGHDRGVKVIARGLRDAGFHVIYSGLWQSPESVALAAQDEDIDWLGLSVLNGAHMSLVPQVLEALGRRGMTDIGVVVGGIIPQADEKKLKDMGVAGCFGSGASIRSIVDFLSRGSPASNFPQYPKSTQSDDIPTLVQQLKQGKREAMSRLLTLASTGRQNTSLTAALNCIPKAAGPVIALTGSGGVGKSSLLGALVAHFVERGEAVGVLACDPESPVTDGALLGDRCRIAGTSASERIFVRSLAATSGEQGIAQNFELILDVMKRFGFDRIFVETVGAGQGDVAIRRMADVVVLVLQPQTGDELQWEKAGILEIADMVVVNKSDLLGADRTVAELKQQLSVASQPLIPIVTTSIARREGIEGLCGLIGLRAISFVNSSSSNT